MGLITSWSCSTPQEIQIPLKFWDQKPFEAAALTPISRNSKVTKVDRKKSWAKKRKKEWKVEKWPVRKRLTGELSQVLGIWAKLRQNGLEVRGNKLWPGRLDSCIYIVIFNSIITIRV